MKIMMVIVVKDYYVVMMPTTSTLLFPAEPSYLLHVFYKKNRFTSPSLPTPSIR